MSAPWRIAVLLTAFVILAALVLPSLSCSGHARSEEAPPMSTAIVGATVVDPLTGAAREDQIIVVERERIARVGSSAEVHLAPRTRIIEAHGKWAVPGLIDSHVHFFQSGGPYTRPDIIDLRDRFPYAEERARTRKRIPMTLRRWLASGVTAVADLGGPVWNFDVRETARRLDAAPHVVVAGPLISTIRTSELDVREPPILRAESPAHARALAREQLEHDPDFLKFWFIHQPGDDLDAQTELVRAVAEVAHGAGKRLVVHATELEVAKASIRAGADILAHSVQDEPVDETFLRLARERGVIYVTTLFVNRGYELALSGAFSPTQLEQRLGDPDIIAELRDVPRIQPPRIARPSHVARENLRRVWDAGIVVAVGSDAGNIGTVHGPGYFREIEMLADAGLTPAEILRAATTNGARVMGLSDTIGALEADRVADIVILDADPLEDARNLARIHRVVRGGKVFDPASLVGEEGRVIAQSFRARIHSASAASSPTRPSIVGPQRMCAAIRMKSKRPAERREERRPPRHDAHVLLADAAARPVGVGGETRERDALTVEHEGDALAIAAGIAEVVRDQDQGLDGPERRIDRARVCLRACVCPAALALQEWTGLLQEPALALQEWTGLLQEPALALQEWTGLLQECCSVSSVPLGA